MKARLWQDWVLIVAAAWLLVSPFILGFASLDHPAAWFSIVLGIFLMVSATEALVLPDAIEDWVDLAIGFALMASPWVAGFRGDGAAALNVLAVGFVVTIIALIAVAEDLYADVTHHRPAH